MVRWVVPLLLLSSGCSAATPRPEPFEQSCAGVIDSPPQDECAWPPLEHDGGCPAGTHWTSEREPCEAGSEPIAISFDEEVKKTPEARALAEYGMSDYDRGRYDEAEDLLARGYEKTHHYWFAYALAHSKRHLGRHVEALALLRAITLANPPHESASFERVRKKSEAAVAELEQQVGTLKITVIEGEATPTDQPPLELTLNSQLVSASTMTAGLVVSAGDHHLSFRGRCGPVGFHVNVDGSGTENVDVALSRLR